MTSVVKCFNRAIVDSTVILEDRDAQYAFLEKVANAKRKKHYAEVQNQVGGIMIDLDIVQEADESFLTTDACTRIASLIFDELVNKSNGSITEAHIACIKKPKLVETDNGYKDGVHFLIPGIWVSKEDRIGFVNHLVDSVEFNAELNKLLERNDPKSVVDSMSGSVPVFFVGQASKPEAEAYALEFVRKYRIVDSTKKVKRVTIPEGPVRVHELSLGFNLGSDPDWFEEKFGCEPIVPRVEHKLFFESTAVAEVETYDQIRQRYKGDALFYDTSIMLEHLGTTYKLVYGDLKANWAKVIVAIKSLSRARGYCQRDNRYFELAMVYCHECNNRFKPESLQNFWDSIDSELSAFDAKSCLMRYVKASSGEAEARVLSKFISELLLQKCIKDKACTDTSGVISDADFAELAVLMIGHVYRAGKQTWYEYNNYPESKKYMQWTRYFGKPPSSLVMFLTKDLVTYVNVWAQSLKELIMSNNEVADVVAQTLVIHKKYQETLTKLVATITTRIGKSCESLCSNTHLNGTCNILHNFLLEHGTNHAGIRFEETLDTDPWVRGFIGGLLRLRKGKKPEVLTNGMECAISKSFNARYVPFNPRCPIVRNVLKMIKSCYLDNETSSMEYTLYYFSGALDAEPKDHMFLVKAGNGSNGKTILIQFVKSVIGEDYVKVVPSNFLTSVDKNGADKASSNTMMLKGATMACYTETEKGAILNCARIKSLAGGESITSRKLYCENETFAVNCLHILCTNFAPEIHDNDNGIWRRIRYLDMKVKFVDPHEHNPENYNERIKDHEVTKWKDAPEYAAYRDAFLSILTYYNFEYHYLYDGRMTNVERDCPHVLKDTQMYMYKQNPIERFIGDCIVRCKEPKKSYKTPAKYMAADHSRPFHPATIDVLAAVYNDWATKNNVKPIGDLARRFTQSSINPYLTEMSTGKIHVDESITVVIPECCEVPDDAKPIKPKTEKIKEKPKSFEEFMDDLTARYDKYSKIW